MINKYKGYRMGGGDDKKAAYDATQDSDYIQAQKLLKKLAPQMARANHKMTQDEIFNSLPSLQQNLINSQKVAPVAAPGANWGAINNVQMPAAQQQFNPVVAPQYAGGMFNGPNKVNPASLETPAQNFVYQLSQMGLQQGGK